VLHRAAADSLYRYPAYRIARWQVLATAIVAAIAGGLSGWQGAFSGALGGFVNVSAGLVFAAVARLARSRGAGGTVMAMIHAEAGKIMAIVVQLWLILTAYHDVVHAAFFAAFVLTVLVTQAAILIRD
jgi:F0F1-type ATP synthase assembly protein I